MAKGKKNHYYILVASNGGPKFVTKINWSDKTAEWNYKEKPMELDKGTAESLLTGLLLNFNMAYLVVNPFEIDCHPYNYKDYKIDFKEREKEDEDEDEEDEEA